MYTTVYESLQRFICIFHKEATSFGVKPFPWQHIEVQWCTNFGHQTTFIKGIRKRQRDTHASPFCEKSRVRSLWEYRLNVRGVGCAILGTSSTAKSWKYTDMIANTVCGHRYVDSCCGIRLRLVAQVVGECGCAWLRVIGPV